MPPLQLELPSSLKAVLRGGGGGCIGQSCGEHFRGPKQCVPCPPPHPHPTNTMVEALLICCSILPLACFPLCFSLVIFCLFSSLCWFFLLLSLTSPFFPYPPPLSSFLPCLSFSHSRSYLHPYRNNLSDDMACVVFPDQSPGANS